MMHSCREQPSHAPPTRRSESHVSLPDLPFCMKPGCINGPRQRDRMAVLRDTLGYSNFETDEDKQWQQILMH